MISQQPGVSGHRRLKAALSAHEDNGSGRKGRTVVGLDFGRRENLIVIGSNNSNLAIEALSALLTSAQSASISGSEGSEARGVGAGPVSVVIIGGADLLSIEVKDGLKWRYGIMRHHDLEEVAGCSCIQNTRRIRVEIVGNLGCPIIVRDNQLIVINQNSQPSASSTFKDDLAICGTGSQVIRLDPQFQGDGALGPIGITGCLEGLLGTCASVDEQSTGVVSGGPAREVIGVRKWHNRPGNGDPGNGGRAVQQYFMAGWVARRQVFPNLIPIGILAGVNVEIRASGRETSVDNGLVVIRDLACA